MVDLRAVDLAGAAVFGALAAALVVAPLSFPFPPIPYLKFDLAEIPIFTAYFLMGPWVGFLSATLCWVVHNLVGEFVPLGPAMKYAAVVSTLAGLHLGVWLLKRVRKRSVSAGVLAGTGLGALTRSVVMTMFNYLVLVVFMPFFFEFAVGCVEAFFGISFASDLDAFIWIFALTAVFNVLHTLLSVIPAYLTAEAVRRRGVWSEAWLWT